MLSMDDIKYIKRLYEKEEVSIREIMRRTGYHYETIKKYLELEDFNEPLKPPMKKPSLLDPLKPIIDEWLIGDLKAPRKQRHTAKRIYDRLLEEFPQELEVKQRTVQAYVAEKKSELFQTQQNKAKLPLYHPPGEAQVDFGHFSYFNNAGDMIDALKLTVSFPYSNKAYCQIFGGENQQCLLQGLKNIFEYVGHVPYRMVFDNLSTAVAHVGKGHERTLTDGFKRFKEHYKFEAAFCNSAAGWEKGNVENKVGYERRNMFVPIPTILDFIEFNKELFIRCDKDGERGHYVKGDSINYLFQEELIEMVVLNKIPYEVFLLETRIADNWAKVSFSSNKYSTSPQYNNQTVYLKITSSTVIVMTPSYEVIVEHPRIYGKGEESMIWLPYLTLMSRKPMAIKYTSFYEELPDNWQKFLQNQDKEGKRKGLVALHSMLLKHDMRTATAALTYALDNGVHDADSVVSAYHSITSPVHQLQPMQSMQLPSNIQDLPSFPIDNHKYDDLFSKEVTVYAG